MKTILEDLNRKPKLKLKPTLESQDHDTLMAYAYHKPEDYSKVKTLELIDLFIASRRREEKLKIKYLELDNYHAVGITWITLLILKEDLSAIRKELHKRLFHKTTSKKRTK